MPSSTDLLLENLEDALNQAQRYPQECALTPTFPREHEISANSLIMLGLRVLRFGFEKNDRRRRLSNLRRPKIDGDRIHGRKNAVLG